MRTSPASARLTVSLWLLYVASQWADGIPPVMGAHLMASGTIAPISTSKGPGIDVPPHQFQYPGEANAQVVVYATAKNASAGLAKSVVEAAAAAIKEKGSFTLVLSGMSQSVSGTGKMACMRNVCWTGSVYDRGLLAGWLASVWRSRCIGCNAGALSSAVAGSHQDCASSAYTRVQ